MTSGLMSWLSTRRIAVVIKWFAILFCVYWASLAFPWTNSSSAAKNYFYEMKDSSPVHIHDSLPVRRLLNAQYSPNNVYYVWCGRRYFQFSNYLSVLSVIRYLRPDNIFFYYEYKPWVDRESYYTWFQELVQLYPFFQGQQLNESDHACINSFGSKINMTFVYELLTLKGGMFMSDLTVLTQLFPSEYRLLNIVHALDDSDRGLLMTKHGYPGHQALTSSFFRANTSIAANIMSSQFSCLSQANYSDSLVTIKTMLRWATALLGEESHQPLAASLAWCLILDDSLYPKNIWELDNSLGRLSRTLFYGHPEIIHALPSYEDLVPNIAHVIWIGGGDMDFLFYLCVLSLLHIVRVDTVYIHGDNPPWGPYWDLIKTDSRIELIYRQPPARIYGTDVKVSSHISDIWRVDFMIKYGGIYVDTDVIFVKTLDHSLRGYEAVATYDFPNSGNEPFPDLINFGVTLGKRNAPYWRLFQESMRLFRDKEWTWNGLRQPYKVFERNPGLIKIEPHLQVVCFYSKCHPTWWPDYHNIQVDHLTRSMGDWREAAYSYHWTHPTPSELLNHTTLLTSNHSMFTEIGQFVLKEAGMLDYFNSITIPVTNPTTTTITRAYT